MAKPEKRWQLLLMADDGRIIPFKRIKGIAVTMVILMVLLGLLCAGLGWQLSVEKTAHQRTINRLAAANRQVAHYKREQEMTAAELVLAKARMEKAGLPVSRHQETPSPQPAGESGTDIGASAATDHNGPTQERPSEPADLNGSAAKAPPAPAATAPSAPAAHAAAKVSVAKPATPPVELGDLEVRYNAAKKVLRAKLRVKNTGPRSSPVAGRCVVVLKSEHMAPRDWLTLPPVPLVGGKPDGKAGQSFRISNFIDLAIKAPGPKDPSAYKTASVYVFDTAGATKLEKDFPVDLPSPAVEHDPGSAPAPTSTGDSMTTDTTTQTVPGNDPSRSDDAEPVK